MKKTYITPEVKVYCVKAHSVIAASITPNNVLGNQNQLSKGGYYDDEDDEYDY